MRAFSSCALGAGAAPPSPEASRADEEMEDDLASSSDGVSPEDDDSDYGGSEVKEQDDLAGFADPRPDDHQRDQCRRRHGAHEFHDRIEPAPEPVGKAHGIAERNAHQRAGEESDDDPAERPAEMLPQGEVLIAVPRHLGHAWGSSERLLTDDDARSDGEPAPPATSIFGRADAKASAVPDFIFSPPARRSMTRIWRRSAWLNTTTCG